MRTLKLVALGVLFIAGAPWAAHAQAPAAEGSRFFFNISFGGQWREQTFTDSSTFPYYQETGAVAAAHSIGGGTLFDIGVAARVWKNAAIGLAYSTITNKNDAAISVRVPHPLIFGQSRIATTTAPESRALGERRSSAVHVDDPADQQDRRHGDGGSVVLYRAPDACHRERPAGHQRRAALHDRHDHQRQPDGREGQPRWRSTSASTATT